MSSLNNMMGGSDGSSDNTGAGQAISGIGKNIIDQTAVSPQQAAQTSSSFDIGKYLQGLFGAQVGMNPQPANALSPEQQYTSQGPLAQSVYDQTVKQAQDPTGGWQSTLQPQLQQAQDQINEYYNARGLDNSGIAIGKMGEAGVDLAIQNAQNEMQYQQQSLSNAGTLSSNISTLSQKNAGSLEGLFENQQSSGLTAQSLANQGLIAGSEYQAYPQQAALGNYYGAQAAQQALPGQLLGAGATLGASFLGGV